MDLYPDMYLGTDAMRKTQMVGPQNGRSAVALPSTYVFYTHRHVQIICRRAVRLTVCLLVRFSSLWRCGRNCQLKSTPEPQEIISLSHRGW